MDFSSDEDLELEFPLDFRPRTTNDFRLLQDLDFLEISDDSDQDLFMELQAAHDADCEELLAQKQSVNPLNKKRNELGEYHMLFNEMKQQEERFQSYLRMSPKTFQYILDKIESKLQKEWCNLHPRPIYPEERLVVTLRYLITGSTHKAISESFRMGRSTVTKIIKEVNQSFGTCLPHSHEDAAAGRDERNFKTI